MGKQIKDLTDEELSAEHKKWEDYIKNATGWGAALSAADEFKKSCEIEMRIRREKRAVTFTGALERVAFTPTHKHVKRGTYYEAIAVAKLQVSRIGFSGFPANGVVMGDGDEVVVYRDANGNVYVRERREFQDGRFAES
jgi:hypothetical protein